MLKVGLAASAAVVLFASASAVATPLNLILGTPDISSFFVASAYNATTDVLTSGGIAATYDLDGVAPPDFSITGGGFNLVANISSSGALLPGGSFTITGSIAGLGAATPLLVGTPTAFGFNNSPISQIFEFRIALTGGSLAGAFPGEVGIIMNMGSGFGGSFNTNFANNGSGVSDTARIVPAPLSAAVLGFGLLAANRRRR
ncbi:MAG: hypothetical protein H7210_14865 [Pyrinomonadaceae bacterium]|nr:hypothetical protein [Phycisphaerales bacterium]